jgi:ATP-dependent exoDNAse (exonuclease V) alpha subunit
VELAIGDEVRATKNVGACKNNQLYRVVEISDGHIGLVSCMGGEKRLRVSTDRALHIDQGIAVTSHASQGKTVDQVIASAPVSSFSQVNQAQFYVSMSRGRQAMHLFTDSKDALKQAVCRTAERLSPSEIALTQEVNLQPGARTIRELDMAISR